MGPFGSSIKVETFVAEGVPVIAGAHLSGVRLDDGPGYSFIRPDHADRLARANVRRGDVVLTHRGTIGQVSYIPPTSRFDRYVVSQSQFYIRCNPLAADSEFVARYLQSPVGQHKLLANAAQVGVPSIAQPVTYLRGVELPLPPLCEQRAIARVLGALDDRIELNRRMNATLEAMVRALYKSWFVDFDPVRAKVEGRDTGLPSEIAELFPDRLVESELGAIPEGWKAFRLDDLAQLHRKTVSPAIYADQRVEHFSIPAFDAHRVPVLESGNSIRSSKTVVPRRVVLLSKLNPGICRVWLPHDPGEWPQVCSTEFLVYSPRPQANRELLYSLFSSDGFRSLLIGMVTGTSKSHQRVQPKALSAAMVLTGTSALFERYGRAVSAVLQECVEARLRAVKLAGLRDTLLPKLISGEIRLPAALVDRYGGAESPVPA